MDGLSEIGSLVALMWDSQFISFVILLPLCLKTKAPRLFLPSSLSVFGQDKLRLTELARLKLPGS